MADNVAQQIKNLSDEIARLDKGLENTKALADKIFENSSNIGDALQKSFRKGDDAAKETTAVLKELLKTITDNFGKGKELKLAIGIEKNKLRHDIAAAENKLRELGKNNPSRKIINDFIKGYREQINQLSNFERTFADLNNVINGDKGKQQSAISKQRVKDEKDVQKIQEQTTAVLQKRIELEERLKTLKPNGKAWRDTKVEIENVNKEVQNYLAKMGSLGTAGARQLKAYEEAGLITNADKTQLALERQQIDLLRQRMQAEEQLNRLLLQRNNATLAGKTVSPKVADSISRLQERIDTIDKQRLGNYQNFTQTSLQRIEGMWQNHETALTNIKTQGAQSRQRILDRQTADEQKAIEQQRKLAQRYAEIESLRNQALGGKKYGELNKTELAQWQNFSTLLADVKKQMDAIESKHPGSLLKGQSLQSTDALLQQTKENIRQRDIESKRQAAAEEKKIERELVEEAKRAAKEKSDAEKQRLEIERENLRNWQAANKAATQEADRLAKAQAKARSAEAKQTFKRTDSESVSNLKRQAEIKQQIARIDHERQLRAKTNSQISTQQAEAERKSYSALQSELSKLISQQKERERLLRGTTAQASTKIGGYADRLQVQEAQRYRQELEKIGRQQEKNKRGLEDMLPTLQRLAGAFGVAFSVQGLVNFGRKLVETRGEFELQQVALRSILQNKQLADEIWDKTMQAALQSPFTAMQLTKYTKQLAAYRIETDKLFDTTKRLADVSAGLGVDMQRLILAYGQVKAANYLRASEIRQFTEAGVNVLGELRDYFNDVKGMSVDTAKVMDMVQKRLVTFSDVEAIFKRMTDQGGIFYNMQYVQSQTVKGQINKLHDAYDQMLNSIGKGNEGAIKNMVSLLNNIVKNWREWKTVLDTIAWPLIITSVIKFGRGLLTVGSSARIAAGEIKGLELAGTKLRNFIGKTNPWIALATAVTAATFAIINHVKAVRATQKEIDEQNLRLYETKELMSGYQKTLEENNRAIKEGRLSEDELNKKRKENSGIISKLKEEYPDIVRGLDLERDGTDKLTESLKNYNDELERRMTLQNMLGTGGGWFSDTVRDNIQQWETDLSDLKGQLLSVQSNARGGMMKMELKGEQDSPLYSELKKISELDLSDVIKASKEYEDILERIFSAPMRDARWDIDPNANYISKGIDIYGFRLTQLGQFPHDIKQVSRETNVEFNNFLTSLESNFESSVSNIKDYSDKISQEYGNDVLRFIANNTDLINQGVLDGNADVVKTIRTVLQSAGVGLTEESRKYYNQLLNERILYLKYQEALNDAEEKSFSKRVQIAMEARKSYVPIDFFATPASSSTADPTVDPNKDKGNKAKESVSAMISLIKEMNSEYGKLSKSAYGFAQSQDKVTDSFRKSFEQIFRVRGGQGTYIKYDDIDFTNKAGAAKALQDVFDQIENANAWGKFAKNAKDEMLKAISGLKVEADIEVKTRIREDFGRQMEDAFGNYELTLDLQKLNLPSGLLKDMFDIDGTDLAAMRQKLEDLSKDLTDENGVMTGDNLKLYEQWLKKLDDEERKLQQQRLKDYSKYLEYQLSDRAKLEMEYVRKVAEVQSEIAYDDTTRQRILDGLRKEYEKNIAKQDWEDFKGSEMYVEMMEDLTKQGTAALEEMRKKLLEVRDNAENLSPRALKEVINALEKIDETIYGRMTPFQAVRELRKQARGAMNENGVMDISEAFERDRAAKEGYEEHRKLHEQLEQEIADKQKLKDISEQLGDVRYEEVEDLRKRQKSAQQNLKDEQEHLKLLGIRTKENEIEYDNTLRNINIYSGLSDQYQKQIDLLTQYQSISKKLANSEFKDKSLKDLLAMSKEELDAMGLSEEEMKNIGEILKYWKLMRQAEIRALEEVKNYLSIIQSIGKNTADMLHTLGVEQNPLSDYWEQATDAAFSYAQETIEAIKQFKEAKIQAEAISGAGEDLMTGNYIKLALRLLGVLLQVVNQIGLFRGARIDKSIEDQQKRIDALTMAYERLESQIEKAWNTTTYMRNYAQMVQNIREQITATEAQMAAARERKRVDQSEINGYQSTLYELYDQLEELEQKSIEVFGGIGEEGYRSAAEGFVEAWKSAFLETGDGLQGLQDHFDEFLQEWFVKQATMRIAGNMLQPMFEMIDKAVDPSSNGGVAVTMQELEALRDWAGTNFPIISDTLEDLAGMFGVGGEGSLSGLAAGIQGMTEEQANILEAYWNSVRMYTASIDMNVSRIAEMLGAGGANTNPMLQQMSLIAANTQATHQLLQSVTRSGHSLGGYGIKVFND